MRRIICGGPLTGKTTYAKTCGEFFGVKVYHTDDLMHLGWSECSEAVSELMSAPGDWIIEGVAAVRAIRKWLEKNPYYKPDWDVYYMSKLMRQYTKRGQAAMAKGVRTVFEEIEPKLVSLEVKILNFTPTGSHDNPQPQEPINGATLS